LSQIWRRNLRRQVCESKHKMAKNEHNCEPSRCPEILLLFLHKCVQDPQCEGQVRKHRVAVARPLRVHNPIDKNEPGRAQNYKLGRMSAQQSDHIRFVIWLMLPAKNV
jgi:hypothetical protein